MVRRPELGRRHLHLLTGITAKVLSDGALELKRPLMHLRDILLRAARGIGSPPAPRSASPPYRARGPNCNE
jgi:hypothetical protein